MTILVFVQNGSPPPRLLTHFCASSLHAGVHLGLVSVHLASQWLKYGHQSIAHSPACRHGDLTVC